MLIGLFSFLLKHADTDAMQLACAAQALLRCAGATVHVHVILAIATKDTCRHGQFQGDWQTPSANGNEACLKLMKNDKPLR